jgi:hypothetical protein
MLFGNQEGRVTQHLSIHDRLDREDGENVWERSDVTGYYQNS